MMIKEQSFVLSCREVCNIAEQGEFSSNFLRVAYNVHLGDCPECLEFVCQVEARVPLQSFPMKRLGQTLPQTIIAPETVPLLYPEFLPRWRQWRPRWNQFGARIATAGAALVLLLSVTILGWQRLSIQTLAVTTLNLNHSNSAGLMDYSFLSPKPIPQSVPSSTPAPQLKQTAIRQTAEFAPNRDDELLATNLRKPEILRELDSFPGQVRGEEIADAGRILAPVGVIAAHLPAFRWTPVAGATSYQVRVADAGQNPVLDSGLLSGTTTKWAAPTALPGGVYSWAVIAQTGEQKIVLPGLEQPEAKFAILNKRQQQARTKLLAQPRPSLPLAFFYAQAGMVAEAQSELNRYLRLHPSNKAARQLRQRLRHW